MEMYKIERVERRWFFKYIYLKLSSNFFRIVLIIARSTWKSNEKKTYEYWAFLAVLVLKNSRNLSNKTTLHGTTRSTVTPIIGVCAVWIVGCCTPGYVIVYLSTSCIQHSIVWKGKQTLTSVGIPTRGPALFCR